jgi:hypothetical protein
MKSATIKKLMVNLKPDGKPVDRLIYEGVESIPLKERGAFFREALLLAALFKKNHSEVLKIASLVASMHENPTIETVLKTYKSMSGNGIDLGASEGAVAETTEKAQKASDIPAPVVKNAKGIM